MNKKTSTRLGRDWMQVELGVNLKTEKSEFMTAVLI